MKLLIRNLSRTATGVVIQAVLEAHGTVQYKNLVMDKDSGGSKGFAFVDMPNAAMQQLNGACWMTRKSE